MWKHIDRTSWTKNFFWGVSAMGATFELILSKIGESLVFLNRPNYIYISALASAPSRPPNPTLTIQNQAFSKKKAFKSPKNSKKQGVLTLTVNIIPISHKSAKIAIFSCQKNRVPNKIKT